MTLTGVADIILGQSPPSSTYNTTGEGLPFFQGKADFGDLYPEITTWCSKPGKLAHENDILLSVRAPVGPTNLAPSDCCVGRGLAAVRPKTGISPKYLLYALRCSADELNAKGTGTTFKAVSGTVVRTFELPIAPQTEQNRISDALDEILSDLDVGVAGLEAARAKLPLCHASVLKAAFGGDLTAEWRQEHPDTEPASELLKCILAERRRRWEGEQLRQFDEKGQAPPQNWREKYKEPAQPETATLPPLPNGWCWARAEQLCGFITKGTTPPGPDSPAPVGDIPFVKVQHLSARGMFHFFESPSFVSKRVHENFLSRSRVLPGDVLMNIVGPPLGQVSLVPEDFPEWNVNQAIAIFRPINGISNLLLALCLTSVTVLAQALKLAKTTAGQVNLTLETCRDLCIPLPPLAEQAAIVELVEDHLSVIDHLESEIDAKLAATQSLRQSILRHAFTGQLVPQDPNDEPASELLKRIAAERAAAATPKKKAAKAR